MRALVAAGTIGRLRWLRAGLTGTCSRRDHRFSAALGGGALYDVACYGVDVARFVTSTEPLSVVAFGEGRDPSRTIAALLEMPDGVLATVVGSLVSGRDQHFVVGGTDGTIAVERPFDPGWDATGVVLSTVGEHRRIEVSGANHFLHQIEHFGRLVLDSTASNAPAEDGVANAIVLGAIAESYRRNAMVSLR